MPRFKFSMEDLLKVKKLMKRQAEGEYSIAQKEYDNQQAILSKMTGEYQTIVSEMNFLSTNGTAVHRIMIYSSYSDLLKRRIKSQQQVVVQAANDLDAVKSKLIGLMREINTLSEIKERQYYQYSAEMEKRHQNVVDEYSSYKIYEQGGLINDKI